MPTAPDAATTGPPVPRRWWQRWSRVPPLVRDSVLGVTLAGLTVLSVWLNAQMPQLEAFPPSVWTYLTGALLCLALTLRRRAPLLGLVLCGALFGVFRLSHGVDAGSAVIALFLAIVAAGSTADARRRNIGRAVVIAAMMALVGWSVYGTPSAMDGYPAVLALQAYSIAFNVFYFFAAWVLGDQLRLRRQRESDLAARTAELTVKTVELEAARQRTAEKAATEERLRLARELHDVLGHHVSVMGVQAAAARRILPRDPDRATEALSAIEGSSRQAVAELQRVLRLLRTDDRDAAGGLLVADRLQALARELRAAGLAVTVQVDALPPLPTEIDLALGRVVQESLTNVLRHAGPGSSAWVSLAATAAAVEVEVVDDAGGQPLPEALRGGAGSGLTGMRERVELHGGRFSAGRTTPRGFRVHAHLPLPADVADGAERDGAFGVAVAEPSP